jgi:hypothetical protein
MWSQPVGSALLEVFALLSIVNVPPYIGVSAVVALVVAVVVVGVVEVTAVVVVVVFVGVVVVVDDVVEVAFVQEDSTIAATSAKLNPYHNSFFLISSYSFFVLKTTSYRFSSSYIFELLNLHIYYSNLMHSFFSTSSISDSNVRFTF